MDLSTLTQPSVTVGRAAVAGNISRPASHLYLWLGIGMACALAASGLIYGLARSRTRNVDQPPRARDVFRMPGEVDGFTVVALLRRLGSSPLVTFREPQREELQQDMQRVQQACFGSQGMSEAELRLVAEKWLRLVC